MTTGDCGCRISLTERGCEVEAVAFLCDRDHYKGQVVLSGDLLIDERCTGLGSPVYVRATYLPTGEWAEATASTRVEAFASAMRDLRAEVEGVAHE